MRFAETIWAFLRFRFFLNLLLHFDRSLGQRVDTSPISQLSIDAWSIIIIGITDPFHVDLPSEHVLIRSIALAAMLVWHHAILQAVHTATSCAHRITKLMIYRLVIRDIQQVDKFRPVRDEKEEADGEDAIRSQGDDGSVEDPHEKECRDEKET